jgi:hypothetical protein
MSVQMMLSVPDHTVQLAESISRLTGIPVQQIISNLLDDSLPLIPPPDPSRPVASLNDDEVLALSNITLQPTADKRHLELLRQQSEGLLSAEGRAELQRLHQIYDIALLYKTQAMIEAVKRGLRTV